MIVEGSKASIAGYQVDIGGPIWLGLVAVDRVLTCMEGCGRMIPRPVNGNEAVSRLDALMPFTQRSYIQHWTHTRHLDTWRVLKSKS